MLANVALISFIYVFPFTANRDPLNYGAGQLLSAEVSPGETARGYLLLLLSVAAINCHAIKSLNHVNCTNPEGTYLLLIQPSMAEQFPTWPLVPAHF